MDESRVRTLLTAERERVQALLDDTAASARQERVDETDPGDRQDVSQPLEGQGVDDAVAASLRDRLAAIDRAEQRVEDGSYGRSVRSGDPIPDERLEADPAAELTVTEAAGA